MSFTGIDKLFGTSKRDSGYELLKARLAKERSVEVLWRLAQFCHERATMAPKNERLAMINEGIGYAEEGLQLDPNHFKALKWCAVLIGQSTEYSGSKKKIEDGKKFKELLDRAISIQGTDGSLFHLRGRFKYTVANMTWLEKKLASTLYSTVPTASYAEALEDFDAAAKLVPNWIENSLYIAKSYIGLKDKPSAKAELEKAVVIKATSDKEQELLEEAQAMLSKL